MRILFIAPSYYPHIGGVEYVVKSVAERLAKASHEVTVVAGEPNTDKPYEEVVNGVRVARWSIWSPGNAYHIPRKRGELERFSKSWLERWMLFMFIAFTAYSRSMQGW